MLRHFWKLVYSSCKRLVNKKLRKIKRRRAIKLKGQQGEAVISNFLSTLPNGKLLNDLILVENGHYTQVDHIFITDSCMYVIETKNYSGEVHVDADSDQWTVVYSNGRDYKLYSPIKQNSSHVKKLAQMTGVSSIKPLTVFPNPQCCLVGKIEGVHTLDSFKDFMRMDVTRNKNTVLSKEAIYIKLKKADQSHNSHARKRQEKYASKMSILNKK